MESKFEELIGGYLDNQVGISDHFFDEDLSGRLRQNLMNLEKADRMKNAGIGNMLVKDPEQNKRGDKIFWIEQKTIDPAERAFLDQIENFIQYLNQTCYTGINAYEFHYALYHTGSSYKRHVDQFKDNNHRKFSLISYLNKDWKNEDGGELLIYQADQTKKILPRIQKTVFFRSNDCEHEVSESSRPRMSITGWLKSC